MNANMIPAFQPLGAEARTQMVNSVKERIINVPEAAPTVSE